MTTVSTSPAERHVATPLASLAALSRILSAAPDLHTAFQLALDEALRVTAARCGHLYLTPDGDTLSRRIARGCPLSPPDSPYIREGGGAGSDPASPDPLEAEVLTSGKTRLIADLEGTGEQDAPVHAGVRSALIVPLLSGARAIGVLHLHSPHPHAFDASLVGYAEALAAQVALVADYARRTQALERIAESRMNELGEANRALTQEHARLETLLRITSELSVSLDLELVLNRTLNLVNAAVKAQQGGIFLSDPAREGGQWAIGSGPWAMEYSQLLVNWAMEQRQAIVVPDLAQAPRWPPEGQRPPYRSAMAVPLIATGDVLGALVLLHSEAGAFNADDLRLVRAAANQVATAINNAELYRLIRDQAERLGQMLREQHMEAAKNRAILEAIADGVMVADAHGRITLFNAAAERILGLSREHMLGRSTDEFLGLFGGGARSWTEAIYQWAREAAPRHEGTFLAERLDIEGRTVSVHLAPVFMGEEFIGSVSVFRDISKEVEIDRLKSDFVSTVSHELRTPLTAIKGYAELLLMGAAGPVSEQQRRFLSIIQSNADRLTLLVHDLLDLSRIESGRIGLSLMPLNLEPIIRRVIALVNGRKAQEGKIIWIGVEVAPDLPPVLADETRVTQILMNLVDNAYNYTPVGGQILIRARALEGAVEVSVIDTGIGISREDMPHIFERFYRGNDPVVQRIPGTGLGLAIVKHLVELHGGHIWVDSEPGVGSTFRFLLPTP